MARKKSNQSPLRQAYQKERKRLQQFQRRAEKRGYMFDKSIVPSIPKRVTQKALEKIKQLRPKKLYERAEYLDIDTGEIVKGTQGRQIERQRSADKRKENRRMVEETPSFEAEYVPTVSFVDTIEAQIKELPDVRYTKQGATEISPFKDTMLSALYDTLAEYDEPSQYEEYLATVYSEIQNSLDIIIMTSDQTNIYSNFSKALSLIKGKALTMQEAIDVAEYSEYLGSE